MQLSDLKTKLVGRSVEPHQVWLANQYPAWPDERFSPHTYLNYQNIEDVFGNPAFRKDVERIVAAKPDTKIVIVAALTKRGKIKGPRIFVNEEASYYGSYELFAGAAHMLSGFVEVFHNVKRSSLGVNVAPAHH